MLKMINAQAKDPGLQKYQDIFRRHPERIFQWAENRSVPAENNMSERGVRRTVIARKVCGGSQSKDALMVREVLQSVIESLRLRLRLRTTQSARRCGDRLDERHRLAEGARRRLADEAEGR